MPIAQLSIDLVAKVAEFEKDLKRATTATEAQTKKMGAAFDFVKGAIAGVVAGLSVGMFANAAKEVADYADGMGKMSQKVGIATEQLSGLAYAASLSDVSNETLGTGLKKLGVLMTEAAAGGEKQIKVLKELGITQFRDVNAAMLQAADSFSQYKEGADKGALAAEVFGLRAGPDMLPLLNSGADGIRAATKEAEMFGIIVGRDAVKAAEEFNDNLTRLATLSQGAKIAIMEDLVDGIGRATKAFLEGVKSGDKWGGMIEGLQVLLTGDDTHKNNVRTVEDTEALAKAEKYLASVLNSDNGTQAYKSRIQAAQEAVKAAKEQLNTTLSYRKLIQEEEAASAAKPKTKTVDASVLGTGKSKSTKEHAAKIDASTRALSSYVDGLGRAVEKTADLSEHEKALQFLLGQGIAGQIPQVRELVLGLADQIDLEKQLTESRKQRLNYVDDLVKENQTIESRNEAMALALEEMGLTVDALGQLKVARMDEAIAQEQGILAGIRANNGSKEEILLIEKRIELMQKERGLQADSNSKTTKLEADKLSADASQTIEADLKSALSNAFRDSKDPIGAFGDALANVIYTRASSALADSLFKSFASSSAGSSIMSMFGMSSFAVGTDYVPRDMLAMVHKGEKIVPAATNAANRSGPAVMVTQNFTVGDVASISMVRQAVANSEKRIGAVVARQQTYS